MKCVIYEISSPEIFDGDTRYLGISHCNAFSPRSSFYEHEAE